MERFVQLVVGGGLCLLAGLWLVSLTDAATAPWVAGAGLAALGTLALLGAIATEVDV